MVTASTAQAASYAVMVKVVIPKEMRTTVFSLTKTRNPAKANTSEEARIIQARTISEEGTSAIRDMPRIYPDTQEELNKLQIVRRPENVGTER